MTNDPKHFAELDGLRGLACLMVLVSHYLGEVPHGFFYVVSLGWVGVSLFFCLSGFLIGGILVDRRDSPRFFSNFYIRRSFRIFPIYYLTVSCVVTAIFLTKNSGWTDPAFPPVIYFTYMQNIALSWTGNRHSQWLLPTWTLAVEEQFYLLLPLLIFWVPVKRLITVIIVLIVSASVFRFILLLAGADHLAVYVLLPSRWDLLLMGVLAAIAYRRIWPRIIENNARLLQLIACSGVVFVVLLLIIGKHDNNLLFDLFGPVGAGLACSGYMLFVIKESRRFHSGFLRYIGSISYGLYLMHQPINGLMHGLILGSRPDIETPGQIGITIVAAAVSIGLASLSWIYFERPLVEFGRRLGDRVASRRELVSRLITGIY